MAGIYLHIPFCKQACHYCDFHFSTNQQGRPDLVKAMVKELELQKEYLKQENISTIYFGGGTPSLLSADELQLLLDKIHTLHTVSPDTEITLEANPDDLSQEKLSNLRYLGINRLSIGIQSFDEQVLKFFNRAHNATEAIKCIEDSRKAGFHNLSLDLIYAVPGQSHEQWKENILTALKLQPEHLSSYNLTIEEKTAFGNWFKNGKLRPVEEEFAAEEFEILMDEMERAGYEHYEISNFCKPDFHSRHNSNYWKQEKYLGIGPSAHSYDGESRQFNVSNNVAYIKALNEGKLPFEKERLSQRDKINEYIFTTLRTSWGCDLNYLKKELAHDLISIQSTYLDQLLKDNLVIIAADKLKLTRKGKLFADKIASDLFITL